MDHLQTEARNPASLNLDELTSLQIVQLMNAEDARVIPAVAAQAEQIARAIEIIAERLRAGGRLIYAGAGTSGRLGVLDATECPPTFNTRPEQVVGIIAGGQAALTRAVEGAEDHPEFAERDLAALNFTSNDVLVGIATSGRTPYVLGALQHARRLGAFTIGLTCNADGELIDQVDLAITPVVGPEILSGSTRLKAGTATKLVLNMLTTGAMVRLGKTYGNLMVDLRVTNEKLSLRANRIVRQLTGLDRDQADALLSSCGGELKTALVVQLAGLTPDDARQRLQAAGGQVRSVLGQAPTRIHPFPTTPVRNDLLLGIDGGGTHTVALLAIMDECSTGNWRILGRGTAGPSNMQAVGGDNALAALDEAVTAAFAAAALPRGPVAAACLGLAGAGRPDDQAFIRQWAAGVGLAITFEVTSDARLLLVAGTPNGWGVSVVCGTGSMVFAQDRAGRTARAGGWGYLLGDEGSGYALALAGLRAVARAADKRGPATQLTATLCQALNIAQPSGLIAAVYRGGLDRAALSALAPHVLVGADQGDSVAEGIAIEAAAELALAVSAAVDQLQLPRTEVPMALAGGVFAASASYQKRFKDALVPLGIQAAAVNLVVEPARGAVQLAHVLATT